MNVPLLIITCACVLNWSVMSDSLWLLGTVAHQVLLSMGFPKHEYWNGLSFPTPGDLPDSGIEPSNLLHLLHWQADSVISKHTSASCGHLDQTENIISSQEQRVENKRCHRFREGARGQEVEFATSVTDGYVTSQVGKVPWRNNHWLQWLQLMAGWWVFEEGYGINTYDLFYHKVINIWFMLSSWLVRL